MNQLAITEDYTDQRRLDLLKMNYAREASNIEFELFIAHCKKFNLAPEAGQIFCVPRFVKGGGKVFTTQLSLQGLRTVAVRTGQFQGITGPYFLDDDGKWYDFWIKDYPPLGAKAFAMRLGFLKPQPHFVRFDSYCARDRNGKLLAMWAKMPEHMIGKCAIAGAIRGAFPDYFSGISVGGDIETAEVKPVNNLPPDDDQLENMVQVFSEYEIYITDLEVHVQKKLSEFNHKDLEGLRILYSQIKSGKLAASDFIAMDETIEAEVIEKENKKELDVKEDLETEKEKEDAQ